MANSILIHEDVGQLLQEAGCTEEFTRQLLVVMEMGWRQRTGPPTGRGNKIVQISTEN